MIETINQSLAESMELTTGIHETLSPLIAQAGHTALNSLSNSGKLCFASCPGMAPLATLAIRNFMHGKEHLRPPLPALMVSGQLNTEASLLDENLSRALAEIRAVATPPDCLLLLLENSHPQVISALDTFTEQNNLSAISILPITDETSRSILSQRESELMRRHTVIPLFVSSIARKQELTLFILNCLGDMIENALFGSVLEH